MVNNRQHVGQCCVCVYVCANPRQKQAARNRGSGSLSPRGLGLQLQPETRQEGSPRERSGPAPGRLNLLP